MSSSLATTANGSELAGFLDDEKVRLIKNTILKGASDIELELFIAWCRSKQLDPLAQQAYAIRQGGGLQPATTIHGMRAIAARTGVYGPQDGPYWCGRDGQWVDVWLQDDAPAAAKVGVKRTGQDAYTYGVATWKECGQAKAGRGGPWATMPAHMLAVRAEASALRRVFPHDLSGVYTKEELEEEHPPSRAQRPAQAVKSRPAAIPETVDAETGEIETTASVKREIQALAKQHELTNDDLKTVASDLNLPPWVRLHLGQACVLRNELIDRINKAQREDEESLDTDEEGYEQDEIIDADVPAPSRDWTE